MPTAEQVIAHTRKWIGEVVVGCNFCPFAAPVAKQNTIRYRVSVQTKTAECLKELMEELALLGNEEQTETAFLIFPNAFRRFNEYLNMLAQAEKLLKKTGYEGIYQLASFHPGYFFANSHPDDAANYTNRSPYPMLHLLREASISRALEHFPEPEQIPVRNVQFAREKGAAYMKMLRDSCFTE